MKRINLSVDVEDNEVLDKSLEEALRASARQIAREEMEKVLLAEVRRITEVHIHDAKEDKWSKNSRIDQMAKGEVDRAVKEALVQLNIPEDAVKSKLDEVLNSIERRVDYIITSRLDNVAIEDYVKEKVEQEVKAKVPDTLLDIIVRGMREKES